MIRKKILIENRFGLHARPASLFVEMADRFESSIFLIHGNHKANGRSILDVMAVAAGVCEVIIEIDGPDEKEALEALLNTLRQEKCIN